MFGVESTPFKGCFPGMKVVDRPLVGVPAVFIRYQWIRRLWCHSLLLV